MTHLTVADPVSGKKEALADRIGRGLGNELGGLMPLVQGLPSEFLAKAAVFSRRETGARVLPIFLLAWLSARAAVHAEMAESAKREDDLAGAEKHAASQATLASLAEGVFAEVVADGEDVRELAGLIRSGVTGRKSFGSTLKRLIRGWFAETPLDEQVAAARAKGDPSLADVIRMLHPRPKDEGQRAFFAWAIGKPHNIEVLPAAAREARPEVLAAAARPRTTCPPGFARDWVRRIEAIVV